MSEREEPSLSVSESASLEHGYRRPVAIAAWLLLARGVSRRSDSARAGLAAFFGLTTLSMLAVLAAGAPVYATPTSPRARQSGSSAWCRWC